MKWVEAICLVIVTACVGTLLLETTLLVREARFKLDEVAGKYEGLVEPSQKAIAQVAAAGKVLAQIGAKERDDFDAQQAYYKNLTSETAKTLQEVNDVVPKAGVVLDGLSRAIADIDGRTSDLAQSLTGTVTAARPLLVAVTGDAVDLRPAIQNFSQMTAHGVGISASLEDISGRVDKAVGKALAPKNKFLAGINAMAKGAITVAEFIFYVTH